MSETVIIVSCVLGALAVISIVALLIYCITSPRKDDVTHITTRRRPGECVREPAQRPMHMPKPPPYSEAPPAYEAIETIDISRYQNGGSATATARNMRPSEPTHRDDAVPSTSRPTSTRDGRCTPHPNASAKKTKIISNDTYDNRRNTSAHSGYQAKSDTESMQQQEQELKRQHSIQERLQNTSTEVEKRRPDVLSAKALQNDNTRHSVVLATKTIQDDNTSRSKIVSSSILRQVSMRNKVFSEEVTNLGPNLTDSTGSFEETRNKSDVRIDRIRIKSHTHATSQGKNTGNDRLNHENGINMIEPTRFELNRTRDASNSPVGASADRLSGQLPPSPVPRTAAAAARSVKRRAILESLQMRHLKQSRVAETELSTI